MISKNSFIFIIFWVDNYSEKSGGLFPPVTGLKPFSVGAPEKPYQGSFLG
jgi:hypothetical protein